MSRTALVFSEAGLQHETPEGHPECAARLTAIRRAFQSARLDPPPIAPAPATRADLLRIHTEEHIETIHGTCLSAGPYEDPDTYMGPASWDAALLAAGGAIEACKAVISGAADKVFSAMRPPGHHAEADRAMGFCLFNNVAIAARWLQAEAGIKRVAILDWDVHHGNGTQHSFYNDATVYYVSLHQFPHYPGTGRAEERGAHNTTLNIPMAPGTPAEVWLEAIEKRVVPELGSFDPDFLLISCGFDAHILDPLGDQNLQTEDYALMTGLVKHLAGGRIVSLLEGGYHLRALGESAVAHFTALQDA
jgi:acetoin utilization deacetylase AcuC-like enzyme